MKSMKKLLMAFVVALSLSFIAPSFMPQNTSLATVQAAGKIKLNKKKIVLNVGQSTTLKLKGTSKKIKWTSSNKKVAKVSSKGKVTAKKAGTAKITAKVGKKRYNCSVIVEKPSISQKKMTLRKGESKYLMMHGTTQKVKWTSRNKGVVSVNKKGRVIAKKTGKATVIAEVNGKTYTCKVTVKKQSLEKPEPVPPTPEPEPVPQTPEPEPVPPTPEPEPVPPTVSDNYNTLKQYILTYGSSNSSGNKFIVSRMSNQGDLYSWGIVYESAIDKFRFVYTDNIRNPRSETSIAMYVDLRNSNMVYPEVTFVMYSPQVAFQTKAEIIASNYTENTNLYFDVIKTTGYVPSSSIQNLSNIELRLAFNGWEQLLMEKTGLTLQQLGFLSYN